MYASKDPGAGGAGGGGDVEVLPPVTKLANELLLFPAVGVEGAGGVCGVDGAPKLLFVGVLGGVEGFPKLEEYELLLFPVVGAAGEDGAPKLLLLAGGGVEGAPKLLLELFVLGGGVDGAPKFEAGADRCSLAK